MKVEILGEIIIIADYFFSSFARALQEAKCVSRPFAVTTSG